MLCNDPVDDASVYSVLLAAPLLPTSPVLPTTTITSFTQYHDIVSLDNGYGYGLGILKY